MRPYPHRGELPLAVVWTIAAVEATAGALIVGVGLVVWAFPVHVIGWGLLLVGLWSLGKVTERRVAYLISHRDREAFELLQRERLGSLYTRGKGTRRDRERLRPSGGAR